MTNKMKNANNLKKQTWNFGKYDNRIWTVENISQKALIVYIYMCNCAEDFNPSITRISKSVKLNRKTVLSAIKELISLNIIGIVKLGDRKKVTEYKLEPPIKWVPPDIYYKTTEQEKAYKAKQGKE
jgi:predicted transcriptional regulator